VDNTSGASLTQGVGVTSVAITDGLAPTLVSVIGTQSDNTNDQDLAKSGDDITVTIDGDENLDASSSTITILGRTVTTPVQVDVDTITGTVTVQSGDADGGVTLTASVADTAGNTLAITQADIDGTQVTLDLTAPTITSLVITGGNSVDNDRYVTNNNVVNIDLVTNESVQNLATQLGITPSLVQINSANLATLPSGAVTVNSATNLDVDFTVDDGTLLSDGTIIISITVTDLAGNTATYDESDTSDFSTATVDNSAPVVVSAVVRGDNTITINYDDVMEASTIATGDFTLIDVNPGGDADLRTTTAATNSGSNVIVLTFDGAVVAPGTTAEVTIATTITNQVGIAPASVINPQSVAAGSTAATVTEADPIIALTDDTFITTISSTASDTQIDISALTANTIPQEITVSTSIASMTFPAGAVLSSLPADEVITVSVSTKTATGITGTIGTIIEFGDPNFDIQFTLPVRIALPDKATGNAFYINAAGATIPITLDCVTDIFADVRDNILTGGNDGEACIIDVGSTLVIWTEHFTAFGAGGGTTASTGGGDTTSNSGKGSNESYKLKPTFGLSHTTYKPLVDDGFSFNDESFDITHNFWTSFDVQTVNVGDVNSFSAKVYTPSKLIVQEFLFGIPEVGKAYKAELGVEIWYDYTGEIEEVKLIQKTNIVDPASLNVTHSMVKCQSVDTNENCDITHVSMKFLEPLKDNVMAIKAIDSNRRSHTTYLNDGFDVSGESLNPMNTNMIVSPERFESLVLVTQTAKYSDIWVTEDGREFKRNDSGTFTQINQSFERHEDTGVMKDRNHSLFSAYKDAQDDRAQLVLENMCPQCNDQTFKEINDIFAYTFPESFATKYGDPEIQRNLIIESGRAQITFNEIERLSDRSATNTSKYMEERDLTTILHDERKQQEKPKHTDDIAYVTSTLRNDILMISGDIGRGDVSIQVSLSIHYNDGIIKHYYLPVSSDGSFYINVLTGSFEKIVITHDGIPLEH